MNELRITLPLPPKELNPNSRTHWAAKSRAVKSYRTLAFCEARNVLVALRVTKLNWKKATSQALFYHPDHRRRDADNLLASLKPAFDGLTDACVLDDDSGLTHEPLLRLFDKENPRVEIRITPAA